MTWEGMRLAVSVVTTITDIKTAKDAVKDAMDEVFDITDLLNRLMWQYELEQTPENWEEMNKAESDLLMAETILHVAQKKLFELIEVKS